MWTRRLQLGASARGLQLGGSGASLQLEGRSFSLLSSLRAASKDAGATAVTAATAATSEEVRADHVSRNHQLVIVGTGWAGYQMFTQCNKHLVDIEETVGRPVDIVVVSKRNVRAHRQLFF
jgi:hypothetical protein